MNHEKKYPTKDLTFKQLSFVLFRIISGFEKKIF